MNKSQFQSQVQNRTHLFPSNADAGSKGFLALLNCKFYCLDSFHLLPRRLPVSVLMPQMMSRKTHNIGVNLGPSLASLLNGWRVHVSIFGELAPLLELPAFCWGPSLTSESFNSSWVPVPVTAGNYTMALRRSWSLGIKESWGLWMVATLQDTSASGHVAYGDPYPTTASWPRWRSLWPYGPFPFSVCQKILPALI